MLARCIYRTRSSNSNTYNKSNQAKISSFYNRPFERDVTDITSPENIGLAGLSLLRENYAIDNWTLQELQTVLNFGNPEDMPAAIVLRILLKIY